MTYEPLLDRMPTTRPATFSDDLGFFGERPALCRGGRLQDPWRLRPHGHLRRVRHADERRGGHQGDGRPARPRQRPGRRLCRLRHLPRVPGPLLLPHDVSRHQGEGGGGGRLRPAFRRRPRRADADAPGQGHLGRAAAVALLPAARPAQARGLRDELPTTTSSTRSCSSTRASTARSWPRAARTWAPSRASASPRRSATTTSSRSTRATPGPATTASRRTPRAGGAARTRSRCSTGRSCTTARSRATASTAATSRRSATSARSAPTPRSRRTSSTSCCAGTSSRSSSRARRSRARCGPRSTACPRRSALYALAARRLRPGDAQRPLRDRARLQRRHGRAQRPHQAPPARRRSPGHQGSWSPPRRARCARSSTPPTASGRPRPASRSSLACRAWSGRSTATCTFRPVKCRCAVTGVQTACEIVEVG